MQALISEGTRKNSVFLKRSVFSQQNKEARERHKTKQNSTTHNHSLMRIQYIKLELVYQLSKTLLSYCMVVIQTNKHTHTYNQIDAKRFSYLHTQTK